MGRRFLFSIPAAFAFLLACSDAPEAFDAPDDDEAFAESAVVGGSTFQNPVFDKSCPDPGVIGVDEADEKGKIARVFYMVCTGGRFAIRRSTDLVTWEDTGKFIFPEGKPPWASDGKRNWAPEIHQLGPRSFVAYYTASDANGRLAIGVARAASPLGPWTDEGKPLIQHHIGVIDATFFEDKDGKRYLYWKVDGNQRGEPTPILVRELARDGRSFKPGTKAREVLTNDPSSWERGVVEAPWVVERNGWYYMFYSGNVYDDRYATGVARARSPLGPFEKKGPPIMKNNEKWLGPGHGAIVRKGGQDWYVHHAWHADENGQRVRDKGRVVLLDRVVWREGWPRFEGDGAFIGRQKKP